MRVMSRAGLSPAPLFISSSAIWLNATPNRNLPEVTLPMPGLAVPGGAARSSNVMVAARKKLRTALAFRRRRHHVLHAEIGHEIPVVLDVV